jgi:hypothetical protein
MRLFCSVGKDALKVLVYIQKPKKMRGTEAQTSHSIVAVCNDVPIGYAVIECDVLVKMRVVVEVEGAVETGERALAACVIQGPPQSRTRLFFLTTPLVSAHKY